MPHNKYLSLSVKESRPGGPWGRTFSLPIRIEEDTLVWDVKTAIFEKKEGYEPAGARLYYLGVPMANCRTLKEYHVLHLGTLHIMKGAQGCVEAGKSCICATQLQHVVKQHRDKAASKRQAETADQRAKLEALVSASTKQVALNRVLRLQVESAILLVSSRSIHNTQAALAAVNIAETMVRGGADAKAVGPDDSESVQDLLRRLTTVLYPRFRKWPPLLVKLAKLVDIKPPRRKEDETLVDDQVVLDSSGMDVVDDGEAVDLDTLGPSDPVHAGGNNPEQEFTVQQQDVDQADPAEEPQVSHEAADGTAGEST